MRSAVGVGDDDMPIRERPDANTVDECEVERRAVSRSIVRAGDMDLM